MANLSVKVTGLKELGQALENLGRKTKNKLGIKAMRKGGVIIRDQAKANAPLLKEQVPYRIRKLKEGKIEEFKTRTGKSGAYNPNDPFYWRFVEFGTSKMPAQPFLQPAFVSKKEQAAREIITTLRDDILREAKK